MRLISAIFLLIFRVLSLVGGALLILALLLWSFVSRTDVPAPPDDLPRTAIVFTGSYDRIDLGLDLLASGKIDQLLISGANRTSGLIVDRFPRIFDPAPEQADWVADGRVILAPDAHSTIENALETACWLDGQPQIEDVTLITSQRHMARASVALDHATRSLSVVPLISDTEKDKDKYTVDLVEFGKFAATWAITLLPSNLWPGNEPSTCASD